MLRPEQMSKVSVAGSKRVLRSVVETTHELHLLHISDYDASWEGFDPGGSMSGAETTNEKLVTVRALENILDIAEADVDPEADPGPLEGGVFDDRLESIRIEVNELDDRRTELRDERRTIDDQIDSVEPFADLGIDLDLLSGYDSIVVAVGTGDEAGVRESLEAAAEIEQFELFTGQWTIGIFARPAADAGEGALSDALVGVDFATYELPDLGDATDGTSPEAYVEHKRERKATVEDELAAVEDELDELAAEHGAFLLAAEETLTIEAQKQEAPLSFATTENAFVAEGWIPTDRYEEFESTLRDAVGDHVEIEEIRRASFKSKGGHYTEDRPDAEAVAADGGVDRTAGVGSDATAADGSDATAADGSDATAADEPDATAADEPDATTDEDRNARADGGVVTREDEPPVVQNTPKGAKSFEMVVQAVSRPKYSEFDPTILVFLTFPLMFGFMIGDIGYGILYVAIGYYYYSQYDSRGFRSIGGIAMWAGAFTILFGILYGFDVFGVKLFDWAFAKGVNPGYTEWALGWLVVSVLFGILHLNIAFIISFVEDYQFHGLGDAIAESGSWLLMLNGFWVWVLSSSAVGQRPAFLQPDVTIPVLGANLGEIDLVASGAKPEFIFTTFNGEPFPLGFAGFGETIGIVGLLAVFVGIGLLLKTEPVEVIESLDVIVNAVSYTRITAVLLAKAGMALAVNLLTFGAYIDEGGSYQFFFLEGVAGTEANTPEGAEFVFGGLMANPELPVIGILLGIVVFIIGHIIVLMLGITAAGIQGVRLEFVEFFTKFYEGGGRKYSPFGYRRIYTADD